MATCYDVKDQEKIIADLLAACRGLLVALADARANGYEIVGMSRAERYAEAAIAKASEQKA